MGLLSDLPIRKKLLFGFLSVVGLFAVTAVFSLIQQENIHRLNERIQEEDVVLLDAILNLEKSLLGIALEAREVEAGVHFNNDRQVKDSFRLLEEYVSRKAGIFNLIRQYSKVDPNQLKEMLDTSDEYISAWYAYSKAVMDKNRERIYSIYLDRLKPVSEKIWPRFDPVKASAYDQLERAGHRISETQSLSQTFLLLCLGVTIVVSCGISWWISNVIVDRIRKVMAATDNLKQGDLSRTCHVDTQDETGKMARSLNGSVLYLRDTLLKVKEAGNTVQSVVDSTKESASSISRLSSRQAVDMGDVSVSSEKLVSTLSDVSGELSQTSASADTISEKVNIETARTLKVSRLFNDVENSMLNSTQSISRLAEQSVEIESILDVIKGIAEQTNLLALNAAIEAARAGEQGRGFAVVADEVRTLAKKTQDSTSQIESMLSDLKQVTNATVDVIHQSDQQVKDGASLMLESKKASEEIQSMILEINGRLSSISEMTIQQTDVSKGISHSITRLNELATVIRQHAQKAEEEASVLFTENQQLSELISSFRL
ncbi:MAG: hypothetical protein CSA52_03085 [Gammaproteobacteria bacterium]|nr:MAG: hypothetical protein CSB48_03815 [Pseudomonadota bacterium]PIE38182.1 MAG: hypothetical protein CSA52_03085 [Gammaproteobacteria bacterium]